MNNFKGIKALPEIQNVFFSHYICDKFDEGTRIHGLYIFHNNKFHIYDKENEVENLLSFSLKVDEFKSQGLVHVHWNQNGAVYGCNAINLRYYELTKEHLNLEYENDLDLAAFLIEEYGNEYIGHSRLDKLAELNNFTGHSKEMKQRSYPKNRTLLLSKIYFNTLKNTLKFDKYKPVVRSLPLIVDSYKLQIIKILKPYCQENCEDLEDLILNEIKLSRKINLKLKSVSLLQFFQCLFEHKIVISSPKKDLVNWIIENFRYSSKSEFKDINFKYAETILTIGHSIPRSSRLINVDLIDNVKTIVDLKLTKRGAIV